MIRAKKYILLWNLKQKTIMNKRTRLFIFNKLNQKHNPYALLFTIVYPHILSKNSSLIIPKCYLMMKNIINKIQILIKFLKKTLSNI